MSSPPRPVRHKAALPLPAPSGPSPLNKEYQTTLMTCVLNGTRSFDSLLDFADFSGHVDTGKSSACAPITWDGGGSTVLLLSVYKDRWRSDDSASLKCHPIYVARTVQKFFSALPRSYGISACLPIAAADANINLGALYATEGVGAPMRKFIKEQLKDRERAASATTAASGEAARRSYRVRLAIFQRAEHGDFYKWCRASLWGGRQEVSGGFEGFRKLMFEIVWALSVTQTVRPGFKHNDLHAANLLITMDAASPMPASSGTLTTRSRSRRSSSLSIKTPAALCTSPLPPPTAADCRITTRGEAPCGGTPGLEATLPSPRADQPYYLYSHPSRDLEFAVPAWPGRAMLADFDFCHLPGTPQNQKVVDFEEEDSVWGVCTTRDDSYDMFMLCYHIYITHFEQLLERDASLLSEIFDRCRTINSVLALGGRALARNVLAAGGGSVAGINSCAVQAGRIDMSREERDELMMLYTVSHINDLRTFHLTREQLVRLWQPQRDLRKFIEWIVPARFFSMTDAELSIEGIHRWRYNNVAVKRGLLASLRTPAEALEHDYFASYTSAAKGLHERVPAVPPYAMYTHPISIPADAMPLPAAAAKTRRSARLLSGLGAFVPGGEPQDPVVAAGGALESAFDAAAALPEACAVATSTTSRDRSTAQKSRGDYE